jgi:hypothetical protein
MLTIEVLLAFPGQARDVCHLMTEQHMPQRLNELDGGVLIDHA